MKYIKYLFASAVVVASATMFTACSDDEFTDTIFPTDEDVLDPSSYSYKFDKWLQQSFLTPYNLELCYKMEDVETDMNYNLVPATYQNAVDLALLTKYLWFDAYNELAGEEFLMENGPRKIHLIGSPAYNPSSGTMILGLAEGGIKVSLFRVNSMDVTDFSQLNEYYFKTMHHEFAHILHQKKSYPVEFNQLSVGNYDDNNWQDRNGGLVASLGFVTNYASSQFREDFAETIANYITRTPEQYDFILWCGEQGWYSGDDETDQSTAYCYYYYANESDRENDIKSYTLQYTELWNKTMTVYDELTGTYITSPAEFDAWLERISRSYTVYPVEDRDGKNGKEIILQKVNIARTWLADSWGIDLDKLREIVQTRQNTLDGTTAKIEELRKQIDTIQ